MLRLQLLFLELLIKFLNALIKELELRLEFCFKLLAACIETFVIGLEFSVKLFAYVHQLLIDSFIQFLDTLVNLIERLIELSLQRQLARHLLLIRRY